MSSRDFISPSVARIIAGAFLVSPLFYAAVGVGVVKSGAVQPALANDERLAVTLALVFLAVSVGAVAASFLLRRTIAAQTPKVDAPPFASHFRAMIVAMALADAPAVMGLVYAFITGDIGPLFVLCGISIATTILHFPRKAWFDRITGETRD